MEEAIRDQLGLQNFKILKNNLIDTDKEKLFIKYGVLIMIRTDKELIRFQDEDLVRGEFESLKAIQATGTIMCPTPVGVVSKNGMALFWCLGATWDPWRISGALARFAVIRERSALFQIFSALTHFLIPSAFLVPQRLSEWLTHFWCLGAISDP